VTAVAAAAAAGMDSSNGMVATIGRAKSLGQGSVGYPDAGALSVTVICEAMRHFIAG
jgi:dihydroxyacetone kinase-like protein